MKLARIILPLQDNVGTFIPLVHSELKKLLISRFGGYTACQGEGGWGDNGKRQIEAVMIYDVAMHGTDTAKLCGIARRICRLARQKHVMIVLPSGRIELVTGEDEDGGE